MLLWRWLWTFHHFDSLSFQLSFYGRFFLTKFDAFCRYSIIFVNLSRNEEHRPRNGVDIPVLPRNDSTSEFMPVDDKEVEYFFASDASAVIEHTNRVIYLEVRFFTICIVSICIVHDEIFTHICGTFTG